MFLCLIPGNRVKIGAACHFHFRTQAAPIVRKQAIEQSFRGIEERSLALSGCAASFK